MGYREVEGDDYYIRSPIYFFQASVTLIFKGHSRLAGHSCGAAARRVERVKAK